MNVLSLLSGLVKGKVLVAVVGVALLGTAGLALGATESGHTFVQSLTGAHATATPTATACVKNEQDDSNKMGADHKDGTATPKATSTATPKATACEKDEQGDSHGTNGCDKNEQGQANEAHGSHTDADDAKGTPTAKPTVKPTATACTKNEQSDSNLCPGHPEAQQLATEFSLSTGSKSASIQLICSLHDGTFKGTVDGKTVTTNHPLGYGEIEALLAYVQSLAKKDNQKLTDSNILSYVAAALKNCASTGMETCVNINVPGNHTGDDNNNGHDMNGGKPTVVPTPHFTFPTPPAKG